MLFVLALCIAAGKLPAQGSVRPVVGTPRAFTPPAVRERILPNGMRIAMVPYGTTPTARVELVIRTGRAYEEEAGLAQLVGDYLLEGTATRDAPTIARELAALGTVGGGLFVVVGTHETMVAGEVLAASAPALIRLIAEIATRPAFDAAMLERLKTNYRRRIQSQSTSASAIASARVNAILFPGDPADRSATDAQLERVSIAHLRAFHAEHIVARRSRLYVAGVFDAALVDAAAAQALAGMQSGTKAATLPRVAGRTLDGMRDRPVFHLIDRPGATQSRIQVSMPVVDQTHPDHLALNELVSLMGSVQTSRIVANVRERHGYSYNVSARLLRRPAATTWTVQADVNRDVTGAALREILGELDLLPSTPPTDDELRGFQRFMAGGMTSETSTARGILDYLRFLDLYETGLEYLTNLIPSIFAVTPTELLRVYTTYLRPEQRVIVVIGDAKSVDPQLRELGQVVP